MQVSRWPAGKILGGSTHVNFMLYVEGHEKDFISWKNPASNDWSYDDITYYFKKAKNLKNPHLGIIIFYNCNN